jgi:hypothetical protein
MSGFGYSDWSYDLFEKMVIFPPDPLFVNQTFLCARVFLSTGNIVGVVIFTWGKIWGNNIYRGDEF